MAKSADLILIILDANRSDEQKDVILTELDKVGIRLNKERPHITIKKTAGGGVQLLSRCKLTKVNQDLVRTICKEYKLNNAHIKFDDDYEIDDLIDTLEGNRCYVKGLFVYNKIDTISIEEVDKLAHLPDSVVLAANIGLGNEYFLEKLWEYLGLVRIYTKKKNEQPDFEKPIVLRKNKGGFSVRAALTMIHRELVNDFKEAIVWGKSVKYCPQKVGINHILEDEDVLQILKKSGK